MRDAIHAAVGAEHAADPLFPAFAEVGSDEGRLLRLRVKAKHLGGVCRDAVHAAVGAEHAADPLFPTFAEVDRGNVDTDRRVVVPHDLHPQERLVHRESDHLIALRAADGASQSRSPFRARTQQLRHTRNHRIVALPLNDQL